MTEPSPVREQSEYTRLLRRYVAARKRELWLIEGIEEAHQLTRHHKELWASKVINDIDKVLERLLKGVSDGKTEGDERQGPAQVSGT